MNTAVLVLYTGAIDHEHLASMQGLAGKVGTCSIHDIPWLDHARSYLASYVLEKSEADVLVWIDDDIIFRPEDVLALAEECRNGHPVIGGVYSSRKPGGIVIGGGEPGAEATYYEGGGITPVRMLGMGFTAIHRSVYEAVGNTLPTVQFTGMNNATGKPYFWCMIEEGLYFGEDASFCLRARACGFSVEADTRIRLEHKGTYKYKIEDTGAIVEPKASLHVTYALKQ